MISKVIQTDYLKAMTVFLFLLAQTTVLNLCKSNINILSKVEKSVFEKYIPYTQN